MHVSGNKLIRGLVALILLMLIVGAANLIVTGRSVNTLRTQTQTGCNLYSDIGTAPVKTEGTSHVSKLGITIVTDARKAWYGLGCPGHLAPPSPSLIFWAHHYGIALPQRDVAVGRGQLTR